MGLPTFDLDLLQQLISGDLPKEMEQYLEEQILKNPVLAQEVKFMRELHEAMEIAKSHIEAGEHHASHLDFIKRWNEYNGDAYIYRTVDDYMQEARRMETGLRYSADRLRQRYEARLRAFNAQIRDLRNQINFMSPKEAMRSEQELVRLYRLRDRFSDYLERMSSSIKPPRSESRPMMQMSYSMENIERIDLSKAYKVPMDDKARDFSSFMKRWASIDDDLSGETFRSESPFGISIRQDFVGAAMNGFTKKIEEQHKEGYPLATLWLAEHEKDQSRAQELYAEAFERIAQILKARKDK